MRLHRLRLCLPPMKEGTAVPMQLAAAAPIFVHAAAATMPPYLGIVSHVKFSDAAGCLGPPRLCHLHVSMLVVRSRLSHSHCCMLCNVQHNQLQRCRRLIATLDSSSLRLHAVAGAAPPYSRTGSIYSFTKAAAHLQLRAPALILPSCFVSPFSRRGSISCGRMAAIAVLSKAAAPTLASSTSRPRSPCQHTQPTDKNPSALTQAMI